MSSSKLEYSVPQDKLVCRICNSGLNTVCADLGLSPIANDLVKFENINLGEEFYPLKAMVCNNCWLVQLTYSHQREKIFSSEYPYFSSISSSWLKHAENYVEEITDFLNLNSSSKIIEIASNDGYLLKNFKSIGAKILGVEPCKNVAEYLHANQSKNKSFLVYFPFKWKILSYIINLIPKFLYKRINL